MYRVMHARGDAIGIIVALILTASAWGCGGGEDDPEPAQQQASRAETLAVNEGWFYDLRPKAGDVLVPPRIGLRWQYIPSAQPGRPGSPPGSALSDSVRQSSNVDSAAMVHAPPGITFRVQVVDSLDVPYIRTETKETDIRVTLPPETPAGTYSWWVESFAEGDTSIIAVSERQTFRIE